MKKVLILKSSITGSQSHSNNMIDIFKNEWASQYNIENITERNLIKGSLPIVDDEIYAAYYSVQPEEMADKQKNAMSISDKLIQEVKEHDVIVITSPIYNFSIPSQLKNYFDLIIRAGLTFSYTESGRIGMIKDKKTLILSTICGTYTTGENDFSVLYLKTLLEFIGINTPSIITLDDVASEPNKLEEKYQLAKKNITHFIKTCK